jgi:2Fe-2S ferredoxin
MPVVRFANVGLEVDVPEGTSILDAARRAGAPEGSRCGGVCACSTCHVYVEAGADMLSQRADDERDMLELSARDHRPGSRLGCQTRLVRPGRCEIRISDESFQTYMDDTPEDRDRVLALWLARDEPERK